MKLDWTRDKGMQEIRGGRTVEEQISCVSEGGNLVPKSLLRERLMAELGMRKRSDTAANVFVFGCQFPFARHELIRSCLGLFDRLAPDYTFLDREFCCGGPMTELADPSEREKAERASSDFMKMNLSLAKAAQAKNMVYWCIWCAYQGKKFLGDSGVGQMYFPDLVLESLQKTLLRLPPQRIGYYEGCHTRGRTLAPDVQMDWAGYRRVLGQIEGLTVVDLPSKVCCVINARRIIDIALKQDLQEIVCNCAACYTRLGRAAGGQIKIKYWPQIVLQSLGERTS